MKNKTLKFTFTKDNDGVYLITLADDNPDLSRGKNSFRFVADRKATVAETRTALDAVWNNASPMSKTDTLKNVVTELLEKLEELYDIVGYVGAKVEDD